MDDAVAIPSHRYQLWTMRRNNRTVSAEVVSADGEWQLRIFAQNILFLWHPSPQLEAALDLAQVIRADLVDEHWH